jgi:hypothetical protein
VLKISHIEKFLRKSLVQPTLSGSFPDCGSELSQKSVELNLSSQIFFKGHGDNLPASNSDGLAKRPTVSLRRIYGAALFLISYEIIKLMMSRYALIITRICSALAKYIAKSIRMVDFKGRTGILFLTETGFFIV